jgi:hypothetical protein
MGTASWSREDAWMGLLLNVLVVPGLGTVMVTRAWVGYLQTLLSAVGVALLVSPTELARGCGIGLLVGLLAWSLDSSVRAICAARRRS